MNYQLAELIDFVESGGIPNDLEIADGTGILFGDDIWPLWKEGIDYISRGQTVIRFTKYMSDHLKTTAKQFLLGAYKTKGLNPATLAHKNSRIKVFMNFLHDRRVNRLRDVNEFILKEFDDFLKNEADSRGLTWQTINNYLNEINFLAEPSLLSNDSIPRKFQMPPKEIKKKAKRISNKSHGTTPLMRLPPSFGPLIGLFKVEPGVRVCASEEAGRHSRCGA